MARTRRVSLLAYWHHIIIQGNSYGLFFMCITRWSNEKSVPLLFQCYFQEGDRFGARGKMHSALPYSFFALSFIVMLAYFFFLSSTSSTTIIYNNTTTTRKTHTGATWTLTQPGSELLCANTSSRLSRHFTRLCTFSHLPVNNLPGKTA